MDFYTDLLRQFEILKYDCDFTYINRVIEKFEYNLVNDFYNFLFENSKRGIFFSKNDIEKIAIRHVYECMVYISILVEGNYVSHETRVLDVGSGAGLPGYLFYCLIEKPKEVILLDASKRKLSLLENFCSEKNAYRIKFIYRRIEETDLKANVVVTRALIPFPFNAVLVRHAFENFLGIFAGRLDISSKEIDYLRENNLMIDEIKTIPSLEFLGERKLILISHLDKRKKMKPVQWKNLLREMEKWRI
ncbi:MAG: class I SAM-dependent methyltransferase [Leptospiraceae bacterium]|nr:class I SAM-dependent methyltransferase [Leptospiraceae bacterium]MDW7976212.1 RsmG family class I SAM-dependent methyltransferase [Leptospiraceae bacterium]